MISNYNPGFYWVFQYEGSQKPTIAKLKKNSGWEYMNSEHSTKCISNAPYKVINRIEEPKDERKYSDSSLLKDIQAIHGKEEGLKQYKQIMEMERKIKNDEI